MMVPPLISVLAYRAVIDVEVREISCDWTAPDSGRWERLMLDVAASKIDRQETTERLCKLVKDSKR
jgi:hypothetical protein